jgi:Fe2+ or Zn2+ uptake regulation protein
LQLFKKLGLIEEHHFDEEHHHYEVKSGTEHQHLLCTSCGKVVEFACPVSRELRDDVGKQYNFDITGVEVRMTGLCSSCRSKEGKTTQDRS